MHRPISGVAVLQKRTEAILEYDLHVGTKRQFFTFIFAVFLLNLFCGCIILHKPIYGVAVLQKRTEAILEYYLRL